MGLFQQIYKTYENAEKDLAGVYIAGKKEPLAPIAHAITNASIEISLDNQGNFLRAEEIAPENAKTLFPVSEESAGRSGMSIRPHPLCDQVGFFMPKNKEKYERYIEQLEKWDESEYTHPILGAVLAYVKQGTIEEDLLKANVAKLDNKTGEIKDTKAFIRWQVFGIGEESGPCWTNPNLQKCFARYYMDNIEKANGLCMITGTFSPIAKMHAKGVVTLKGNAKLISANDNTNFTYRGRFFTDKEALTIGYETSQKAHNALRWLIANQGEYFGERMFLCWNPEGKEVPRPTGIMALKNKKGELLQSYSPSDYKEQLRQALNGWKMKLDVTDQIITVVFDAATSGRLSVAYYSEFSSNDFIERLGFWDETCCWLTRKYGIQSPSLKKIVEYAFGTLRGDYFEADDQIMKNAMLRLVSCRLEKAKIPKDIEYQLVKQASSLYLYKDDSSSKWLRSDLLFVTCAVIRKYYYDYYKEDWEMALNSEKKDCSYQYGRLLAVLEKIERDTYDTNTERETNAIRMQSVFVQRPQYASRIIYEQVRKAYFGRLPLGQRAYYDKLIGQIMDMLSEFEEEVNKPLKDTYLLGYYMQKNELYSKKTNEHNIEEE